ncbi:MAG: RDD family protein [Chitinophagaceae bacterium]
MSLKYTGVGTRVINFMIDIILVSILAYIGFRVYNWYVLYYRIPFLNFWWFFAAANFVFYTILESIFSKTPGKWMSQTRVVNRKGFKASFGSIVLRSLIRLTVIDAFFIPFLDKPLHDYLSNTELIQE